MKEPSAMQKVPHEKIWATIESMRKDLDVAYTRLPAKEVKLSYHPDIETLVKIRTLADEIIRWMVL